MGPTTAVYGARDTHATPGSTRFGLVVCLPPDRDSVDRVCFADYTGLAKALELKLDDGPSGPNALLVDDWIETGAQIRAAARLLENQRITTARTAAIGIDDNQRTRELRSEYRCHAVWTE